MLIPNSQILGLTQKFQTLRDRSVINFSLCTSAKLPNERNYFSNSIAEDFLSLESSGFKFHPNSINRDLKNIDVLILTAHGNDFSSFILDLKDRNPNLILATWFWDNHLAYLANYKTALVSDIFYPSHVYCKEYLINPCSPIGLNLPACTAQWVKNELDFKAILVATERQSKIFLNYVDYKFSWRSKILSELRKFMSDAHVQAMPPENRDRYFTLSSMQKYQEWCSYKATLILPVEDFDSVISKELQNELGIIRIKDLNLATIQLAARKAFEIFDKRGASGVLKRFEFISEKHMLKNRVEDILKNIKFVSSASKNIKFGRVSGALGLFIE